MDDMREVVDERGARPPDAAGSGGRGRWPAALGTVAGLGFGMVFVQACAVLVMTVLGRGAATVVGEVGAPLVAIMGAVAGAVVFRRYLSASVPAAVGVALSLFLAELALAFWLGAPWL